MGSAHAAGAELEERVSNNERKITLIKNILNYQDSLLPIPKPEEDDGDDSSNLNIADRLDNIGDALGVIGGLFKLQLKALQDEEEQDRKAKADQDRRARESALEAKKATKSKKKTPLQKGALGFFDRLKKFFLNIAIGAAVLKAIEWLKSPENVAKVESFTKWLEENAGAIFKTLGVLMALNVVGGITNSAIGIWKIGGWILSLATKILGAPAWIFGLLLSLGGSSARAEGADKMDDFYYKFLTNKERGPGKPWDLFVQEKMEPHLERLSKINEEKGDLEYKKEVNKLMLEFIPQFMELNPELKSRPGADKWTNLNVSQFAEGGRPPVGEVVSVGERGRELFVADRSGTIVSNDKTEHVFNDGALLVAKSNTLDKISNTSSIVAKSDTLSNKSSSISQRVNNKHGSSKIIDLRGGQQQGSTLTAGNATTGNQIEGVSSVFPGDILVKAAQVQLGLVG
tara:strand:- start:3139 stop:4509 length:1371 start_codon:yes stop_codon:yes gene_type:complete